MEQVWTFLGGSEARGAGLEWEAHRRPSLCLLSFTASSDTPAHLLTPKHSRAGVTPDPQDSQDSQGRGSIHSREWGPTSLALGWTRVGNCHCVGTSERALFSKMGLLALWSPHPPLPFSKDNGGG